jgi:alpha-beta hydrolase superfamily lysophospholipase
MLHSEGTFSGANNTKLHFQSWQALNSAKTVIIGIHGHGDHSGGLHNIIESIVPLGFSWYGFDLRGHGHSDGRRGHINSFSDYLNDLKAFILFVKSKEPDKDIILIGHSLGGLISLVYPIHFPDEVIGVIAICPAVVVQRLTLGEKLFVKILNLIKPDYLIKRKTDYSKLTRDENSIKSLSSDSLRHETISVKLLSEISENQKFLYNNVKKIKFPLLIQTGSDDEITPASGIEALFNSIPFEQKQMIEYTNALHRPFDDIYSEQVFLDLKKWLQ